MEEEKTVQERLLDTEKQLEKVAGENKNVISSEQVEEALAPLELGDVGKNAVIRALEEKGIDVLNTDEDSLGFDSLEEQEEDDGDGDDASREELLAIEEEEKKAAAPEGSVSDTVNLEDPVRMYLKEIGKVPLLTAGEEVAIAKRMENGEIAGKILEGEYGITPDRGNNVLLSDPEKIRESENLTVTEGILRKYFKLPEETEEQKKEYEDAVAEKLPLFEGKGADDMKALVLDGEEAKKQLSEANLRLVVSIAKKYVGRGMLFLDLIQEGNLGLIKAVEKFDFRRGFKFSTYATWWIRQAITRSIADQARTIRIPVHMVETINRLVRTSRELVQELGREPTPAEVAERMGIPESRVREISKISQEPVSLETPIGEEEDSHLGDFIPDENTKMPQEAAAYTLLREELEEVLGTLTEREQKVLRLRFGLDDGRARTLEEVGKEFNVTRERIRQIEAKALRKLRHPSRSKKLKDYLE